MSIDLKKHWRKCRLCIKKIRNERIAVEITKKIAQDFFDLTNLELLVTENYSETICKPCMINFEQSLEFQQKIKTNQKAIYLFENEQFMKQPDIKIEEPFDPTTLLTEIKTECFDFGSVVTQTLAENQCSDFANPFDPNELPVFGDDSLPVLGKEHAETEQSSAIKTKKKTRFDELTVCPYCGESMSVVSIALHIEAHENQLNNTPFVCDKCEFQTFNRKSIRLHTAAKHTFKVTRRGRKNMPATRSTAHKMSDKEIRQKIIDIHLENPNMLPGTIVKKFNLPKGTVYRTIKIYAERKTVDRLPKAKDVVRFNKISESLTREPEINDVQRASIIGVSRNTIKRVRKGLGIKSPFDFNKKPKKSKVD